MNFTSHMDAVVAVAVGLVNVLTAGEARGRPYRPPQDEARRAAVTAALRIATPATRLPTVSEAAEFGSVAAALRPVFDAAARPRLDRHDGQPWHLHFHGPEDSLATGWAAGCATGLAVVLGTDHAGRLGVCAAPRCDRVYVDISRNATRRFCSTSCQNRVKTAAFRARRG
jgi:predicted RNA-binding Zn ribbon-like protein